MIDDPGKNLKTQSDFQVLFEFLKEFIGYEHGLYKTVVDLRKDPQAVLAGYLNGDLQYASPIKMITTALSAWIFINGFLIDWYKVWRSYFDLLNKSLGDTESGPTEVAFAKTAGDLFTIYFPLFVILVAIFGGYISFRYCRRYGVTYKEFASAIFYTESLESINFLFISIAFAIHAYLAIGLMAVNVILLVTGKSHLVSPVTYRKFFRENGSQIERRIRVVRILCVFIATVSWMLVNIAMADISNR